MRLVSTSSALVRKILAWWKSSQTTARVGSCGMGPPVQFVEERARRPRRCLLSRPPIEETIVGLGHLDALVKAHRRRCRQEQGRGRGPARGGARLLDQPLADALALAGLVDGEIGEIAAEAEIGQRAGEAHQSAVLARGHEQVGVGQHALDPGAILDRPVETGFGDNVDVLFGAEMFLAGVHSGHSVNHLLSVAVTSSGFSSGLICPQSSITTRRDVAMSAAISWARASGVEWSWRPTITTVGASMSTSSGRLSGRAMMACCSRRKPSAPISRAMSRMGWVMAASLRCERWTM